MRYPNIIVYHGSDRAVTQPDTEHSRLRVDFGKGFYTTPFYEQAKKWCEKYKTQRKKAVISHYELAVSVYDQCAVLTFEAYTEAWLDLILAYRTGTDSTADVCNRYDIIEGGVANDKVFNTVELVLDGLINKKEAIKRLKYEKPNWQICFKNQLTIDRYVTYKGSEEL